MSISMLEIQPGRGSEPCYAKPKVQMFGDRVVVELNDDSGVSRHYFSKQNWKELKKGNIPSALE